MAHLTKRTMKQTTPTVRPIFPMAVARTLSASCTATQHQSLLVKTAVVSSCAGTASQPASQASTWSHMSRHCRVAEQSESNSSSPPFEAHALAFQACLAEGGLPAAISTSCGLTAILKARADEARKEHLQRGRLRICGHQGHSAPPLAVHPNSHHQHPPAALRHLRRTLINPCCHPLIF